MIDQMMQGGNPMGMGNASNQSQDQPPMPGPALPDPAMQPLAPRPQDPAAEQSRELNAQLNKINIAEDLDQEQLDTIGVDVVRGFDIDLQSKAAWDRSVDEWVKLAAQVKESKTWPWQHASNVKYPLLATAAMQFAARAYPNLVPADGKVVQLKVIGFDPKGQKAILADKLAKHMNYQLLEEMDDWEEEMDRLLIQLPIVGCIFKKTYFDSVRKRNVSKVVGAKDLVVNYWAANLEEAYRKTEIISMNKNQLKEKQNYGLYLEVELPNPTLNYDMGKPLNIHGLEIPTDIDDATPYTILEQHTFLDLDKDGYAEPYIITVEKASKKVLRIVARWDSDGIEVDAEKNIICIKPVEYYTKYGFIPNPDGGFYDIGFGHLLGPLNESSNTIINQLIDAGTLSNLQSGFIGKGLRLKMGETKLAPGEWRTVNAAVEDLSKQIFPLPVKEPSETLFKLLGMLVQSGKELASVAEIFTGKMPGQNTPATTTMATIEQGMKVFTAIYKRTYRSYTREFKKLFRLNGLYEENIKSAAIILDAPITRLDYDVKSYDVCPTADPTAISTTQKMLKAQQLMELVPLGTINIMEVTKRMLEAQEQPNPQTLMQQPQPKPDPAMMKAQIDAQAKEQDSKRKVAEGEQKMKLSAAEAQQSMMMKKFEAAMKQQSEMMSAKMDAMFKQMEMQYKEMSHQQDQRHAEELHRANLKATVEQGEAKIHAIKQGANARMESKSSNSGGK